MQCISPRLSPALGVAMRSVCAKETMSPWITEHEAFSSTRKCVLMCAAIGRTSAVSVACYMHQGQVLHVTRGVAILFQGAKAARRVLKRQTSKEATGREHFSFTLCSLPSSVETIGCLVSYADDEIARFTPLLPLQRRRRGRHLTRPDLRSLRVLALVLDAQQQPPKNLVEKLSARGATT